MVVRWAESGAQCGQCCHTRVKSPQGMRNMEWVSEELTAPLRCPSMQKLSLAQEPSLKHK